MVVDTAHRAGRGCLPAQPHVLLGREESLLGAYNALRRDDCRLLTLLGPGGIGKTRLGIALAERLTGEFEDGVFFVDLTEIDAAAALPSLVAARLGLQVEGASPLTRVEEYLRSRKLLLLLDNFEHVLDATSFISDLTEQSPGIKILVTSREPLYLRWEQRLTIEPFDVPEDAQGVSAEELSAVPAVALFLQRARAVNMRFDAGEVELQQISAICRWLGGLPLGIELAAARTNVLSPAAILHQLDGMAPVLRQYVPDAPARHQSVAAALDWSYELLTSQERAIFRILGVFWGGFTLEAVQAIANKEIGDAACLDILSSLVDKSLIVAHATGEAEPRFHMLEPIHAYARERLERERDLEAFERAHASYFLTIAERASRNLRYGAYFVFSPPGESARAGPVPWPMVLDADQPNFRGALRWAGENDGEMLMHLAVALARYWWVRGDLQEGAHWLERALDQNLDARAALRSQALDGLGIMYRQQGRFEEAHVVFERAVTLSRQVGDSRLLAAHLMDLAGNLGSMSRIPDAIDLFQEAIDLSRSRGDAWGTAAALAMLGMTSLILRHAFEAEALLAEAAPVFRGLGDVRSVAVAEVMRARAIALQGDVARALPVLEDALLLCREIGQDTLTAAAIEIAAAVAGNESSAEPWLQLLGAAELLREAGFSRTVIEKQDFQDALAALHARLDEESVTETMAEGRRLSVGVAIDQALALVRAARDTLGRGSDTTGREETSALSERQLEVLALLALGLSNKKMGQRLGISEQTAKYHVSWILNELGAGNRAEAVSVAIKRGLI